MRYGVYTRLAVVDIKHHLVVAHDVVVTGSDRAQLSGMAFKAREATGDDWLEAIADRGNFKGTEILACEQAGISTYVPKPMPSNSKAQGRYSKLDFVYSAKDNEYQSNVHGSDFRNTENTAPVVPSSRSCARMSPP
jgi:hypothetical protein